MAKPHKPSSHQPTKKHPVTPTSPTRASGDPVFGQPQPSPDPTTFKDPVTDASQPDVAGVQPVPHPAVAATEPILTLAQIYGSRGRNHHADYPNRRANRLSQPGRHWQRHWAKNAIAGGRQDGH